MQRAYRRILLLAACGVFIVISPLVVLYAIGYRLAGTAEPVSVGVVLIETVPRRAQVWLNETLIGTTPRALSNLPPGEIDVRIERAGYQSWAKRLVVRSGQATELRDVRLFPAEAHTTELLADVTMFSLAPNRQLIAAVTADRQVHVVDPDGEPLVIDAQLPRAPQELLWSPTSARLLLSDVSGSYFALPLEARAVLEPLPLLARAQHVAWDPRVPDRLLFLTGAGTLEAYNLSSRAQEVLVEGVASFATSDRQLMVVRTDGTLGQYTLSGQAVTVASSVPPGPIASVLATPDGKLAFRLIDGSLWVWYDGSRLQKLTSSVHSVAWSPSGRLLYVAPDPYSLYVFNATDDRAVLVHDQLQFVLRLSRPLVDLQWFAGNRHLLYQVEDQLLITEIDTRDHPLTFELDTTNTGAAMPEVGEEGNTLYYLKRVASESTVLVKAALVVD